MGESSRSQWSLSRISGLVFLPWFVVVAMTAGVRPALALIAYALLATSIGFGLLTLVVPAPNREEGLFLAPALGIVTLSAVGAFWLRLGLPFGYIAFLWLALFVFGAMAMWTSGRTLRTKSVAYGRVLALLSVGICLIYFLPSARNDAAKRPDGSYNWIYVDTQHFYAISAVVKSGQSPPTSPGSATTPLLYHFGPYVPAGVISATTGIDLGDCLARITRGASLWALLLAVYGFGRYLSRVANGSDFGGIMAVMGLFFYGSLLSLFSNEANSSSSVTGAVLFEIRGIEVLGDGGPFSHLLLGHSLLHGLVAIISLLGLCLMRTTMPRPFYWTDLAFVIVPALAVPTNSVAALYILGGAGILLYWNRLKSPLTWLLIALMLLCFLLAWGTMGFAHASDAAGASIKQHMLMQLRPIEVWFMIGLGFRILALRWISKSLGNQLSILVIATMVGLLSFSLLLHLRDDNERYGIYFLQAMLSVLAFSRLDPGSWRGEKRCGWARDWFRLAGYGLFALAVMGSLASLWLAVKHQNSGIPFFHRGVLLTFLASLACGALVLAMKRNISVARVSSAVLMCVLMMGFLAWITPWLNFGLDRMRMDVTVTPGEVQGLERLRQISSKGERFATNRHDIDSLATRRERSYAYAALSERPVLLEGYLDRGLQALPSFDAMLRDNDQMFTTTDPAKLRQLAANYDVHWLVARPNTNIALPQPLPSWLTEAHGTGNLRIYHVN
jgi:hypothetical protein